MLNLRLGNREDFPEQVIKLDRKVTRDLHMLLLITPHRNQVGLICQDIRRHENRIRKQRMISCNAACHLIFIGMTALEKPHGRHRRQQPGQLGHFRNIALPKENATLGIQATCQEIQSHIMRIFPQHRPVRRRGQGMIIRNKYECLPLFLQTDGGTHHAEIVAQMQLS